MISWYMLCYMHYVCMYVVCMWTGHTKPLGPLLVLGSIRQPSGLGPLPIRNTKPEQGACFTIFANHKHTHTNPRSFALSRLAWNPTAHTHTLWSLWNESILYLHPVSDDVMFLDYLWYYVIAIILLGDVTKVYACNIDWLLMLDAGTYNSDVC